MKKKIGIGLLGFGTVGRGVYTILKDNGSLITERLKTQTGEDYEIEIKRILVRNLDKYGSALGSIGTNKINDILNDDSINIVVEVMGGQEAAIDYMKKAMAAKKHVVTANKWALFKEQGALEEYAVEAGVQFRYEASVAGVLPIIRVLKEAMIGDRVEELKGIINGSTNYILTRVAEGEDIDEVIKDSRKLGYLEADASSDLDGYDAKYKLGILCSLITGNYPKANEIERQGISNISSADFQAARDQSARIKLIARISRDGEELTYSIKPEYVYKDEPLYNVNGSLNGIYIKFKNSGDMFLTGKGAGSLETGTAVISDIISIARSI